MGIEIKPYSENFIDKVRSFNLRLKNGGLLFSFPVSNIPEWLPKIENRKIYQEYFLAIENNSEVRGAYILKHQEFILKDKAVSLADYQLPISEGTVNKSYSLIGVQLLTNALKRQPLLFGLGMGSYKEPLPKMLKAAGWSLFTVPFFFKVCRPFKFLKNINFIRKKKIINIFLDLIAITGMGWIIIKLLQLLFEKINLVNRNISVEIINDFSIWADEVWNVSKGQYHMIAVRDSTVLNILYPKENNSFIRLKVLQNNKVIGWAIVLDTPMINHKQFGNMRVGSIVDCLALTGEEFEVIKSAAGFLEKNGVDIIVSNQFHSFWRKALISNGFLEGPSNFIFAASRKLTELLYPLGANKFKFHINRGDGDGPIHL
ncbi:MAG: hypothetical protein WCI77_02630 [Candidatus Omnitrophota bacterium]